jgi:hypothetical protein
MTKLFEELYYNYHYHDQNAVVTINELLLLLLFISGRMIKIKLPNNPIHDIGVTNFHCRSY